MGVAEDDAGFWLLDGGVFDGDGSLLGAGVVFELHVDVLVVGVGGAGAAGEHGCCYCWRWYWKVVGWLAGVCICVNRGRSGSRSGSGSWSEMFVDGDCSLGCAVLMGEQIGSEGRGQIMIGGGDCKLAGSLEECRV